MTEVREFRASSMQAAMDIVRRELGADAVILHTRQISRTRLLPWLKPREEVQITASTSVNARTQTIGREKNRSGSVAAPNTIVGAEPTSQSSASIADFTNANSGAMSVEESFRNPSAEGGINIFDNGPDGLTSVGDARPADQAASITARLLEQTLAVKKQTDESNTSSVSQKEKTPDEKETSIASNPAALANQLDSIQKMIENLSRTRQVGGTEEIPGELFHLYTDLIDADVEDDLARDLIFRLRQNCTVGQLGDTEAGKAMLTAMVEAEIKCGEPIMPKPGRRKVVALVGPTGVGKTTTIAKLAANFRLRDGIKMGLVTVDTYRIAAVEQLRTYAEIIDLPMKVVTSPLEMRRALDELVGLDLVLIDTAGRSPRDELQIKELKSLLAEADVDEVHLVMSLTASLRSIQATAEKFAAANTTSLILTKLDEAAGMGALLSVARKVPLPVTYLTTGQDVPDDIEPAHASRIARLVLGQDKLFD